MTTPHFVRPETATTATLKSTGRQAHQTGNLKSDYVGTPPSMPWADGKTGSFFFWVRPTVSIVAGGTQWVASDNTAAQFDMFFTTTPGLTLTLEDIGSTVILDLEADGTHPQVDVWTACFISWDLLTTSAEMWHQEINQAAVDVGAIQTATNLDVAWSELTEFNWHANAAPSNALPLKSMGLSQFWFSLTDMDFSQAANREKFVTTDGRPLDLGSAGDAPGVVPELWSPVGHPRDENATLDAGNQAMIPINGPASA